ncbi:MAG TPA: ABC transporter permease subunit [Methylomirabilota bacterium]|jgi:ABC-type transport system involved in multi-copper enzyme maturation permease subunit|nr:ABC transporter permease subunit [Methylomirabilota bacterium]
MTDTTPEIMDLSPADAADYADVADGTIKLDRVAEATRPARRRRHPIRALRSLGGGIVAIGVKELRGRMRGRRAFVILTLYLLLLAAIGWAWELIVSRHYDASDSLNGGAAGFASALIGQEIFGALLLVETLLVVFLAPAFTAGAISLEREKQTLDMLAATPISSVAIVLGKLLSALTYVFVLIGASIPLTAMVFVFGGVGPDEVLRGYVVLLVSAIGLGSLGLFISALMQRTQAATVVTFFGVIFLTMGTLFVVLFWTTMAGFSNGGLVTGGGLGPIKGNPPQALLWFNPFAAQYDVICGASDGYQGWCSRLSRVTNGSINVGIGGSGTTSTTTFNDVGSGGVTIGPAPAGKFINPGVVVDVAPVQVVQPFGIKRDAFWPRSVAAWLVLSVVLIVASVQLVSPTRRRLPWRTRRTRRGTA